MDFLKALGSTVPLWLTLLVLVLTGMALFVWPRTRRFARHWLLWVTGTYLVFGLPVVANAIARHLPSAPTAADARPISTLVVLDGDNRRGRLAELVRILRTDSPDVVWILGDEWYAEELKVLGIGRTSFQLNVDHANTRDQMAWVAGFIVDHPGVRPTLVVSRLQAPRVAALAEAAHLDVIVIAAPVDDEPAASGWRAWVPSYFALRVSRDALYEHAAIWWYRWNEWI